MIQQAVHQVLMPLLAPEFSESSYGFRPGRHAYQAVRKAREYVSEGCRYADDCNIYVRTLRSGERVLSSVSHFLSEKLKLKVTATKRGVGRSRKCKFLGYSMTWRKKPRLKVAPVVVKRLKGSVQVLCRQGRGRSLKGTIAELTPKLCGFTAYFRLAEVKNVFQEVDEWLRHKLRPSSGVTGNDDSPVRRI